MIALAIKQLSKTYPDGVKALDSINLSVKEGDFFALLGPNGAGKSTTINIISSLCQPSHGSVHIFDFDLARQASKAKAYIGLVPQEFNFNIFENVQDIIINQAGYYDIPRHIAKQRCHDILSKLDLWHKRNTPSGKLSGGMKRRLMIARALIHQPKLLILDEPTAGVDVELRHEMWRFLQQLNKSGITIILTTHYLEEAEILCKNIAIIDQGKLITQSSMRSLLKKIDSQTFIIDVEGKTAALPTKDLAYTINVLDDYTLEVKIQHQQNLSQLFQLLNKHKLVINNIRQKTNQLEELFINLTSKSKKASA